MRPAPLSLVCATLAICLMSGCHQVSPQAKCESISLAQMTNEGADYVALCRVDNPNVQKFQIVEVRWTLSSGGKEINRSGISKDTELPGAKVTSLPVYLSVPTASLAEAGLDSRTSFTYHFAGEIVLANTFGPITLPFEHDGTMPVIHPVSFELKRVEHLGATETRVNLALHVVVSNPNEVPLVPFKLKGNLLINEQPLVVLDCDVSDVATVAARQTVQLRIPVRVSSAQLGVRSLDRMVAAPDATFHLVGALLLRPPGSGNISDVLSASSTGVTTTQPASKPE